MHLLFRNNLFQKQLLPNRTARPGWLGSVGRLSERLREGAGNSAYLLGAQPRTLGKLLGGSLRKRRHRLEAPCQSGDVRLVD